MMHAIPCAHELKADTLAGLSATETGCMTAHYAVHELQLLQSRRHRVGQSPWQAASGSWPWWRGESHDTVGPADTCAGVPVTRTSRRLETR